MKKFLLEFRKFALKGNVMDLAVGVIIGGAFGKIVTSLVSDIIMPLFGIILGKDSYTSFTSSTADINGAVIKYGSFINNIVDFAIISFSVFIAIKLINKANIMAAKEPSQEVKLLTEIRDLLKEKNDTKGSDTE